MEKQKKSKNRALTIGLFILILINVSALITIGVNTRFFNNRGVERIDREPRRQGMMRHRDFEKQLGLNNEQRRELATVQRVEKKQVSKLMKEMALLRMQLNEELSGMELDIAKIEEINKNIVTTDEEIRTQAIKMNIEIRKILDEEQLQQFLKLMKSRRQDGRMNGSRRGLPQGFIMHNI